MTILVTGARGAVARRLTTLLAARDLPHRLASRTPERPGTHRLDLADPATFAAALDGASAVFLYAEAAGAEAFAAQAAAAGVQHIVLLSSSAVLAPDAAAQPLAAAHLAVERALLASPVRTTVLRPGAFAGNARGWSRAIRSGSPVRLPFPGSHSDPVHEADIAEAALAALTDPDRLGGRPYTLGGPQSLTFATQLAVLGRALGRTIPVETVTPEEWKADAAAWLKGEYADALLGWWRATDGRPVPVTDGVERLTGRPARPFETWAADHAAEFRP
ncbi:SDR family oxidoreductase [Streptomyces sp. NRRL S-87]|uniref:SDR family oxidoreductase n=1 Tax=Streptomyces sp. NRRL S-87 TaxID=1463920 RepID=UPI0004C03C08|nr:NAD(P)H-binding protein [Streptomyces sp. NRRL S-87]